VREVIRRRVALDGIVWYDELHQQGSVDYLAAGAPLECVPRNTSKRAARESRINDSKAPPKLFRSIPHRSFIGETRVNRSHIPMGCEGRGRIRAS
jgi:hypothetical protein